MGFLSGFSNWLSFGSSPAVGKNASANIDGADPTIYQLFGIKEGKATVTEDSSLGLSTVYACVDRISKSIATLPWDVFYQPDERTSVKARSHPVFDLLHEQPNTQYDSSTFRRVMLNHLLLRGNFFAEIQVDGGNRPVALEILQRSQVQVYYQDKRLYYKLTDGRILQDYQVIHVKNFTNDGLMGLSPIQVNRETFLMGLETQGFGATFFQNSARPAGVLLHDGRPSPEALKNLKDSWQTQYGGNNRGKTATLTDGWKYQQLGIAPGDAQYLETRKFSRSEICGIFGVPPHMVMDLEHATFSNIENQNIWYVTHTLMPYIVHIEQEFGRKLFRKSERSGYSNKINVHGLLRGDTAAQTAHISAMVDRGVYNRNEARSYLDLNPYDGGDAYLVQGAMTPVDLLADFYQAKINAGDVKTPTPQS